MAPEEEPEGKDGQEKYWILVESLVISFADHGVNMDNGCADSGGGCTAPSGLHLHHHGGLPRSLHLPFRCCLPTVSSE